MVDPGRTTRLDWNGRTGEAGDPPLPYPGLMEEYHDARTPYSGPCARP
jgi:hypothetical protein